MRKRPNLGVNFLLDYGNRAPVAYFGQKWPKIANIEHNQKVVSCKKNSGPNCKSWIASLKSHCPNNCAALSQVSHALLSVFREVEGGSGGSILG